MGQGAVSGWGRAWREVGALDRMELLELSKVEWGWEKLGLGRDEGALWVGGLGTVDWDWIEHWANGVGSAQ